MASTFSFTSWTAVLVVAATLTSTLAISTGPTELLHFKIGNRAPNIRAAHLARQSWTCAGSPIYESCGGEWCAPPGFFCCGTGGACATSDKCIDGMICCPPFATEEQCRGSRSAIQSGDLDALNSLLSSLMTRSDFSSIMAATEVPMGIQTSIGAQITGTVPVGGSPSLSAVTTRSKKWRSLDLGTEVELTDKWEQTVSCNPEKLGQRTNVTGATMKIDLAVDVAGITVSQTYSSNGKLKISMGGVDVSADVMSMAAPTGPTGGAGTDTGCTVTYKWKRSVKTGPVTESVTLTWDFPLVVLDKRQDGGESWGQINDIVVFSNADDLDAINLGSAFDSSEGGDATAAASGPSAAATATGTGNAPTATATGTGSAPIAGTGSATLSAMAGDAPTQSSGAGLLDVSEATPAKP